MYVYIEGASNNGGQVYVVGFYMPNGNLYEESVYSTADWSSARQQAAERVHYLNGGN